MYCYTTLVKILQENFSLNGKALTLSGGLSFRCHKINNFEGTNPKVVNGQRIKHYISGNPINVETNIIETVTPEEYIRDTFQNVSDSKGIGMWYGK